MTSKQVTLPPWNSRKLAHSKEMVWAWRWSVALRTFYRQILSLLYSSFFFWNFRPRLARELLVEHLKLSSNVVFLIAFGHAKSKPFGFSEFHVMVFHEIYFSNLNIYRKIKRFVEQNKQNRKILATGDCKWLTHKIMKLMLMMSVIVRDFNHRRTQQTV